MTKKIQFSDIFPAISTMEQLSNVPEKNEGSAESNKTKSSGRSDTKNLATIFHRSANGILRSYSYPAITRAEINQAAIG